MKKLALLFLLSVAVYGSDVREECLSGNIEACKWLYRAFTDEQCWSYNSSKRTICKEITNVIIKKCLNGTAEACEKIAATAIEHYTLHDNRLSEHLNCKDYMKTIRKGCNLGSGLCCALLGDEFHSISIKYGNIWRPKYGANCSLRNKDEAFKYYKKACDLDESYGCKQYTELQNDIDEIDRRERDKTYKGDITVRQR